MFNINFFGVDEADLSEPLGTKRKFWLRGRELLFKEGRVGTGENWCEKVVSELCDLIGLPHAKYELAQCGDSKGVVSKNFVPHGGRLVHGNELLPKIDPEYNRSIHYHQTRHTLRRVLAVMKGLKQPLDWEIFPGVYTAIDCFIGYLMLDAWIGNQDRHHENWGLIVTADRSVHLAPSYDHASGLGSHEINKNREDRLTTLDIRRGMERYVERALSAFYLSPEEKKPLTTIEGFFKAAKIRPHAAKSWITRLEIVMDRDINYIFDQLPSSEITPIEIDFAIKILRLNKSRLITMKQKFKIEK